jgi:hemerythrin HHE cation binding domain-containing protein
MNYFSLELNYSWHDCRTPKVNMLTTRSSLNGGTARSRVEAALARLSYEDSKLGSSVLGAGVAGAVVARHPSDAILRAEAAEAWNSLGLVIVPHFASEEEVVLPWARMREDFPADLIMRAQEQHLRLRHLAATVDAASFITGTDEEVVKAGSALRAFAVFLDDLIDAEERGLFPIIRRILRAENSGA